MASRPPEDVARARWMIIQAVRVTGGLLVIIGILTLEGVLPFFVPEVAAYGFIAVGLLEVFFMPTILARQWSSREP